MLPKETFGDLLPIHTRFLRAREAASCPNLALHKAGSERQVAGRSFVGVCPGYISLQVGPPKMKSPCELVSMLSYCPIVECVTVQIRGLKLAPIQPLISHYQRGRA